MPWKTLPLQDLKPTNRFLSKFNPKVADPGNQWSKETDWFLLVKDYKEKEKIKGDLDKEIVVSKKAKEAQMGQQPLPKDNRGNHLH